ncbi:MAG: hypothetical protein PF489_04380 [Salinivirgaceae bacterium]|jgi:DUF4097 and DUF4098 domain-containing protein YvlB|nr:hypothetical protein [Salinivirgaceae bacterium]
MGITQTIYAPKNIELKTEKINKNINATDLHGDVSLKSISGDIDLNLNKSANAYLNLKTISRKMFTDFDLNTKILSKH